MNSRIHKTLGDIGKAVGEKANDVGRFVGDTIESIQSLTSNDVLAVAMKSPGAKINREQYLQKELMRYCKPEIIQAAIDGNPAMAGIDRNVINKIAKSAIDLETAGVVALSTAAGIPGGAAIAATIPADVYQYFMAILRVMQKLAYLYGYPEFELEVDSVNDETMNEILMFLGIMFGVSGAKNIVSKLSSSIAKNVAKKLPQKALTQTTVYPIIKNLAAKVGVKVTKQIYANAISDVVPVVGAIVSGGISWATFSPAAYRLQTTFSKLDISNPEFYKQEFIDNEVDTDMD